MLDRQFKDKKAAWGKEQKDWTEQLDLENIKQDLRKNRSRSNNKLSPVTEQVRTSRVTNRLRTTSH